MSGDATPPKVVSRLVSFVPYIPATGFVVDLLIRLFGGVDDWQETALEVGVLWLIGVNGMILGSGHLLMPRPVAEGIGWPTSPFQWEVGLAGVSYGVLGVTASGFEREYTLAAILAFSIFMLGAAVGHVRSMVRDRNFAPGNAGYIFWYDVFAPALLIALYLATR